MASIRAKNLSIHFPLASGKRTAMSGPTVPRNMTHIGSQKYILALQKLNFEISQGERVGLVGRNGSGKSTLLRVLGGIYSPTEGALRTQGKVSAMFNINLGVQMEASGRENIMIRGIVKGWSLREIRRRIPDIIAFSELQDVIDLPMRTYSDGMRMRLLFAIATSFSPEILLLDEWIGAGDKNFQSKATERMNSLVEHAGITVIASHNRTLLSNVCDKVIWLDYGVMRAYGPTAEVYKMMDAE